MLGEDLTQSNPSSLPISGLQLLQNSLLHMQSAVVLTQVSKSGTEQKIIFANPATERLSGYSAANLHAQDMRIFIGEDTRDSDLLAIAAALKQRQSIRREMIYYHRDGSQFWVEVEGTPIEGLDSDNLWLWFKRDISVRMMLLKAVEQREQRWRLAIESIGDGVWDWNIKANSVNYSQCWKTLLGFDENEIGTSIEESAGRIHPDDKPTLERELNRHLLGDSEHFHIEHRVLCKDGSYKWMLNRGMVVSRDDDGAPLRMIGAYSEISSRKKAEELLIESEQRHRVLIDNLQSGVVVHAPDTSVLLSNMQANNLSAYALVQQQAQLGEAAQYFFVDEKKQRIAVTDYPVNYVIAAGTRMTDRMMGIRQRDTEDIVWLMINAYPEFSADKSLSHVVVTFVDMSVFVQAEDRLRLSEERFQLAAKGASFGVWDWDMSGDDIFYSERCKSMLGYSPDDFPDKLSSLQGILHEADKDSFHQIMRQHLDGERKVFETELRLRNKAGDYRWFYARGEAMRDEAGVAYRMAGSIIDITESRHAQEELKLAAMVYEHSSEAMMINDAQNKVIAINPAFTAMTGFSEEDVLGHSSEGFISDARNTESLESIQMALQQCGRWQGEIWSQRKNGEDIAESVIINVIYHQDGSVHRYVTLFSDVTEKLKSEAMIWHQANYDTLTDLPNRNMFSDRMMQEISKGKREHNPFVLLFLDLDHFKQVNDTLGHLMGDELLIEAAKRIKMCVRETDTVSRQGGDEFCVMLSGLEEQQQIERVVQQIIDSLAEPFHLQGEKVFISASIGITLYPVDGSSLDDLLKFADQAMYQAKNTGRNRYSYFTRGLQQAADKRMYLTRELRNAINTEQFELYYQPIVDLRSGAVYKAEALIRWLHPEKGVVSPNDFIPLAEDTGLIVELGTWVFKQAAQCVKEWRQKYNKNFQIAVNKSPVQFMEDDMHDGDSWLDYLQQHDIAGNAIIIEITEGILLDTPEIVLEKMQAFKAAGIGLSLDDFGTGYSSLSYLKKFDIDFIKIDRAFVKNIDDHADDLALCEAIIVMAHKLGLSVIAEGVETTQQQQLLIDAGCDFAQGYLFSRPIPLAQFTDYLQSPPALKRLQ